MSRVQKAGIIILSREKPAKIALLYQSTHKDITFPKGHLEKGETILECAVRETKEETGLDVRIIKELPSIFYTNTRDGDVEVHFFLGESLNDSAVCPEKGARVLWTEVDKVAETLTYSNLKEFFKQVLQNNPDIL